VTGTLLLAAGITAGFALLAYVLKGVTRSGAVAGAIVSFILTACGGFAALAVLVCVFVLTWIATRFGYARKQQLGMAERRHGRNALQVLANLGVAAICSALYYATRHHEVFLLATSAALAEAAADTVSSELGQACTRQARLITTFEIVPAGTDGGITLLGTVAGVIAAAIIALVCIATRLIRPRGALIVLLAGLIGTLADSFFGALLERRGYLNNDLVNFLSTFVAASAGALLFYRL
jgi:uncharacterized protein (TIGR00297 family)